MKPLRASPTETVVSSDAAWPRQLLSAARPALALTGDATAAVSVCSGRARGAGRVWCRLAARTRPNEQLHEEQCLAQRLGHAKPRAGAERRLLAGQAHADRVDRQRTGAEGR